MSNEPILAAIRNVLATNCHISPEKALLTASFADDLEMDSLDQVELVMKLEELFDISITDEQAGKLLTISDAVAFIASNKAG